MAIGWAIVGTGFHARERMAPAMSRAEGTALAAVCSRDLARAKEFAARFGFARYYDSYEALLADDAVEAVYICTPNSLHAEQTVQAARAGKHVLVEKPMALSVRDAECMVEECEKAGVRLGVGFHLRHHPAHPEARRVIAEGRLGSPFMFHARWVEASERRSGWWDDPTMIGAYITMARVVHLIDLVCYLSGREPTAVSMMTDGQRSDRPLEENAVAILRLGDGVFGSLLATRHAASAQNGFAVYGTAGCLQAEGTVGPDPTGTLRVVTGDVVAESRYHAKSPFQEEIEAFNRAVQEGTAPSASGYDGLRVVRVTEALLRSAREGVVVPVGG